MSNPNTPDKLFPSLDDAGDIPSEKDLARPAPRLLSPGFERLAIAAAIALQLLVLVVMIYGRTIPFVGAKTVLLKVIPVDPRDFFRGDYVTLGYDISRLPYGQFQEGETVYATLVPEPDGRHFRAGAFRKTPPNADTLSIQGIASNTSRATYGIETFYVQETTGHDYEKAVQSGTLWAEIALTADGNPVLRQLVIEGATP